MSCLPNTPIAANILTDPATNGWQDVGASLLTSNLSRYFPIVASLITVRNMTATNQHAIVRQIDFEETASSSANIRKHPLIVYMFGSGATVSPASGAAFNPDLTYLIGQFEISASDYKRTRDDVWTATINPNRYIRQTTSATAQNLLLAIVSNDANTISYAAGAEARVRVFTEIATVLP
jgi:hypothetical protein